MTPISAVLPAEVLSVGPGNGLARNVSKTSVRSCCTTVIGITLFSLTLLLLIGLLSNTVCQEDDASGRHDGRWNLLSIAVAGDPFARPVRSA